MLEAANRWNAASCRTGGSPHSVLLITVDALRYDAVQYSGRAQEDWAPNINRFAPRCHRFHWTYAQGGWTSISLPALLWSKYPRLIDFVPLYEDSGKGLHWGNQAPSGLWIEKRFQSPIREPDPNLAQLLSEQGIRTVAILNDESTGYFAPGLGFARHFDDIPYPKRVRDRRSDPRRREANLDEVTADITIEQLSAMGDEQFFIWTHFFSPHGAYEPPEGYDIPFERYYGEVYFADMQVGRVLEQLARVERDRNTIVVISADHGESFWEHNNNTHGKELYDHAMRVPLLLCVPDTEPKEINTPVGLIDIAPTLLDYLGVPIPNTIHGFSLRPLIEGEPRRRQRPPVFLQTWQNEPKSLEREIDRIAVVHGRHKLLLDLRWNVYSLFDLYADPREKRNLLEVPSPGSDEKFLKLGGYLLGWRDIQR
jgi:arylsulfatase A-like enzyme